MQRSGGLSRAAAELGERTHGAGDPVRGRRSERSGAVSGALAVFRDPRSVAVVGASSDPAKWGYWVARGALAGRDRRAVHLVNRAAAEVQGVRCAGSLAALPEPPELVALCVPPAEVDAVVTEGLARGARGFLGITAAVPGQDELAARIRTAGARLLGPNSLGLFDAPNLLQLAWGTFVPGPLAVVSQSGQLGSEIARLAARAGVGVSRFVSIGNQADVTAAELLADLADHDQTRVVAVYLESFAGGPVLVETARALRLAGKPVVLLTVGGSDAGRRAARSHTGSLTSTLAAVDAACRAAGAVRVDTPAQLVELARYLLAAPPPTGRRLAVVGDSGGQGALAADVAADLGLVVPPVPDATARDLAGALPAAAAAGNPVDLAGGGERDLATYPRVVSRLLHGGEVDAVLLTGYFGCYGSDTPPLAGAELAAAQGLAEAAAAAGRPLVVHSMSTDSATVRRLGELRVPVYGTVEAAVRALVGAVRLAEHPGRAPTTAPTIAATTAPAVAAAAPGAGGTGAGYWAARELLAAAGVPFPPGHRVGDRDEVRRAAAALRPPYVLKAAWLEHKSERGGVRGGLPDAAALLAAYDEMTRRLGPGGYLVEEQDTREHVVELLVGTRRDPDLGLLAVVGTGGTEAELYQDVAVELAPVGPGEAESMLRRLRCLPLLRGWRGRPAADVAAVSAVVAAVSELAARRPDLAELELNPVRVSPNGVLAVDALLVPAADRGGRPWGS